MASRDERFSLAAGRWWIGVALSNMVRGYTKKEQSVMLQPKIEDVVIMQSADFFLSGKNGVPKRRSKRDASKRVEQVPCNADTACNDDEINAYIAGMILQMAELADRAGRGSVSKQLMLAYEAANEDRA